MLVALLVSTGVKRQDIVQHVHSEGEEKGFYKVWPANKSDHLVTSVSPWLVQGQRMWSQKEELDKKTQENRYNASTGVYVCQGVFILSNR